MGVACMASACWTGGGRGIAPEAEQFSVFLRMKYIPTGTTIST